jgi:hypothetical protein
MDRAGAGLGELEAGIDGILHRVHANDEERDLALVRARRPARPDGDAGAAAFLVVGEAGELELVKNNGETVRGTLILMSEWKAKLPPCLTS